MSKPISADSAARRDFFTDIAAAAVYLLVIVVFLMPPAAHLDKYLIAGGVGDSYNSLLNSYSITDFLLNGNIFEDHISRGINYPGGRDIFNLSDPGFPLISFLAFLLFRNHMAAFNIPAILNIFLLAIVIGRFSMIFYKNRFLSFFAGLATIFSILSVIWDGLGDDGLIFIIFLFLIFYIRFKEKTGGQALFLGLMAGILTVYNSTYIYFGLLFALFDTCWNIFIEKSVAKNIRFSIILLAGLLLITGPRYLLQPESGARVSIDDATDYIKSAKDMKEVNSFFNYEKFIDIYSLLLPVDATIRPEKSKAAEDKPPSIFSMPVKQRLEGTCYLGLPLFILGILGFWRLPFPDKRRYMFILLMLFIISIGPYFIWKYVVTANIGGEKICVLFPFAFLVKIIPLLKHVRHPGQVIYIVYYFFIVFSVYGAYVAAGMANKTGILKCTLLISLVAVQFISMKFLYGALIPLHADEEEGFSFLSGLRNDGDRFRVGYIDAKLFNSFPAISNRDLVVYTAAVHQKQSVILYNSDDRYIYDILTRMDIGAEDVKGLSH